jgi:hypothetical protein
LVGRSKELDISDHWLFRLSQQEIDSNRASILLLFRFSDFSQVRDGRGSMLVMLKLLLFGFSTLDGLLVMLGPAFGTVLVAEPAPESVTAIDSSSAMTRVPRDVYETY